MARKNINNTMASDLKSYIEIQRTGYTDGEGMSPKRIEGHIKDGYFVVCEWRGRDYYTFTEKGRRMAQEKAGLGPNFEKSGKPGHNVKMLKVSRMQVPELKDCVQILDWRIEQENRNRIEQRLRQLEKEGRTEEAKKFRNLHKRKMISPADATVKWLDKDGEIHETLFEAVTRSYSAERKEAKINYRDLMGLEMADWIN